MFVSYDSYDRLKFYVFAWLGLNPDYAPDVNYVICHFGHLFKNYITQLIVIIVQHTYIE